MQETQSVPKGNELRRLRYFVAGMIALLYIQFELGMDTNLAGPPSLSRFQFSIPQIFTNLGMIGPEAVIHAVNGLLIFGFALTIVVLAFRTKVRVIEVLASTVPFAIGFAMLSALGFVLSGFQDDGGSYGMSHGFIATFTLYAALLYFIAKWSYKPASPISLKVERS